MPQGKIDDEDDIVGVAYARTDLHEPNRLKSCRYNSRLLWLRPRIHRGSDRWFEKLGKSCQCASILDPPSRFGCCARYLLLGLSNLEATKDRLLLCPVRIYGAQYSATRSDVNHGRRCRCSSGHRCFNVRLRCYRIQRAIRVVPHVWRSHWNAQWLHARCFRPRHADRIEGLVQHLALWRSRHGRCLHLVRHSENHSQR